MKIIIQIIFCVLALLLTYTIFLLLLRTNFSLPSHSYMLVKMLILPIIINIPLTVYFYISKQYYIFTLPIAHFIIVFLFLIIGRIICGELFSFTIICFLPISVITFIISKVIKNIYL
jgi:hypothetical protein